MIKQINKEKLINAKRVLDQIVHEIAAIHFLARHLQQLEKILNDQQHVFIQCSGFIIASHFILSMNKFYEFKKHYQQYLPKRCHDLLKKIKNYAPKKQDVNNMRNWCIGHIHKKNTQEPLSNVEFEELTKQIFPRGDKTHLLRLYNENVSKKTLCSILDALQKEISNMIS